MTVNVTDNASSLVRSLSWAKGVFELLPLAECWILVMVSRGAVGGLRDAFSKMQDDERARRERAEFIEWHQALDLLLRVSSSVDEDRALQLARKCKHPDAVWLSGLFPASDATTTRLEMESVMQREAGRSELAAVVLAFWRKNTAEMKVLAMRGNAVAQAACGVMPSADMTGAARFDWCERSAAQQCPWGLYLLGTCFWAGTGCDKSREKALSLYRQSAELGFLQAQCECGRRTKENDPQRYMWLAGAAAQGYTNGMGELIRAAPVQLDLYTRGGSGKLVFGIGAACRAHGLSEARALPLMRCIALSDECFARARKSVYCFLWCAKQRGITRDCRNLIGSMLLADSVFWIANGGSI